MMIPNKNETDLPFSWRLVTVSNGYSGLDGFGIYIGKNKPVRHSLASVLSYIASNITTSFHQFAVIFGEIWVSFQFR